MRLPGVAREVGLQTPRLTGAQASGWKGGVTHNASGYRLIYAPGHPMAAKDQTHVLEHRLVMAEKLGRMLSPDEHVHHINGDKLDNRPENLELLTRSEHRHRHNLERRRITTWSKDGHTCCVECGRSDRKHDADGLCHNCYARRYRRLKKRAA